MMPKMRSVPCLCLAMGAMTLLPAAFAQQQTATTVAMNALPEAPLPQAPSALAKGEGSILGTVEDVNGDAVPRASITLDDLVSGKKITLTADANGFFDFDDLPAGNYRVTVAAKGFAPWIRTNIALKQAEDLDLPEIALKVATATASVEAVSPHQMAEIQMKEEEQQRIIGIFPNFYVVYATNPVPLDAGQKMRLALRASIDPMTFFGTGITAGIEQATNAFPAYGGGMQGFGKRYGAAYADGFDNVMLSGAILPALLHQDPRYFYQGTGSVGSRIRHALSFAVICHSDKGTLQPNYSSIIGTFAAGGLSNLYYPADSRGIGLTLTNASIAVAGIGFGSLMEEFVLPHFTSHKPKR